MKKLKITCGFLTIIFVSLISHSIGQTAEDNSKIKTESRPVSGFNKLEISGSFIVEITQGKEESLKIEANEDLCSQVLTEIKDNTLQISMNGKTWKKGKIKLFLTFKNLDEISSAGSLAMKSIGSLNFTTLNLDLSGSAEIDLQVQASKIKAEMSGSSNTRLSGIVTTMEVEISGAGSLEAPELTSQNFEIEITGSGNANVNVAKELNVEISGSGAVVYKGNPNIKKSISGSGSIKKIG